MDARFALKMITNPKSTSYEPQLTFTHLLEQFREGFADTDTDR